MTTDLVVIGEGRLTLADLIAHYHADPESSFHGLRPSGCCMSVVCAFITYIRERIVA